MNEEQKESFYSNFLSAKSSVKILINLFFIYIFLFIYLLQKKKKEL